MGQTPDVKSGPWILYDTIAAYSFLLGDKSANGIAIGSRNPAISAAGEMNFFKERDKDTLPWYTNLDTPGVLPYGLEVWQAYLILKMPGWDMAQTNDEEAMGAVYKVGPMQKLAEAILNFSIVDMGLGQEEQTFWTSHRFGAGGGLWTNAGMSGGNVVQNAVPQAVNVCKFPEPIQMGRTQNFGVKLRIAPEAHALIGNPAAPGVGSPLMPYNFTYYDPDFEPPPPPPVEKDLPNLPFALEFGLVGKRFKDVQYGQLPPGTQA